LVVALLSGMRSALFKLTRYWEKEKAMPKKSRNPGIFGLADIENLGVLESGGDIVPGIGSFFRCVVNAGVGDLFEVGCDGCRVFGARREFPGAMVRAGFGPDGGERAVIERFDPEFVASRHDFLIIGSGDGLFVDTAGRAHAHGLEVVVASWADRLSWRLAQVADYVLILDDFMPGGLEQLAAAGHHGLVGDHGFVAAA
jgi:hypothetical protein